MEIPHGFEPPEHHFADALTPGVDVGDVEHADVKVQVADGEVLLVFEAGSHEALKDVGAGKSECVVRVVDLVGLPIDLTAGTK